MLAAMGAAVLPSVLTGSAGLIGAVVGATASTFSQSRTRKEERRLQHIEAIAAFVDALDTALKTVARDYFLADGEGSRTGLKREDVSLDDLSSELMTVSAAHTRVMLTVPDPELRASSDQLADDLFHWLMLFKTGTSTNPPRSRVWLRRIPRLGRTRSV
jgi:hypothetical protein